MFRASILILIIAVTGCRTPVTERPAARACTTNQQKETITLDLPKVIYSEEDKK